MKIKKLLKRLRIAKIPKEIKDNTKYCTYCNSKIQSNDTFIQHKGYDFHCDCYIRYLEIVDMAKQYIRGHDGTNS